jgi:hypothetical protein
VHTLGVVVVKVTVSPEVEVALTDTGDCSKVWLTGGRKVIFWVARDTEKLSLTVGAAWMEPLPPWLAATVQIPIVSKVMVAPFVPPAVHTLVVVVVKLTVSPEVEVALTVNGDCAKV